MSELLFDGQHLQVLRDDRGGDVVLVTFNERVSFANGGNYWGKHVAAALGISAVGFVTKSSNWFPVGEMLAGALPTVLPLLTNYKHVVTYGFSQGAYAALKYSRALGATQVLSFSPQWTIEPKQCGTFDRRFERFFDPTLHENMEVGAGDLTDGLIRIFIDPLFPVDLRNARIIQNAAARHCIVHAFNLGHATIRPLTSRNAIAQLLRICIEQAGDHRALFHLIREQKKQTFEYLWTLGMHLLRRGHPAVSMRLYDRALTQRTDPRIDAWKAAIDKQMAAAPRPEVDDLRPQQPATGAPPPPALPSPPVVPAVVASQPPPTMPSQISADEPPR